MLRKVKPVASKLKHNWRLERLRPSQVTIVVTVKNPIPWNVEELARMSAAAPNLINRIAELSRQYGELQIDYVEEEMFDLFNLR